MTAEPSRWRLNVAALYAAVDVVRRHRSLSWRDVAAEVGMSASTLSRMAAGRCPDADGLLSLLMWLGHAETIRPYVTEVTGHAR